MVGTEGAHCDQCVQEFIDNFVYQPWVRVWMQIIQKEK